MVKLWALLLSTIACMGGAIYFLAAAVGWAPIPDVYAVSTACAIGCMGGAYAVFQLANEEAYRIQAEMEKKDEAEDS